MLQLSRRLDDDVPRAALRPARLRPLARRTPGRSRSTPRSTTSSPCSTAGAAVVFGHSYGGNVALALAERHPDLVRAVGRVRGAAVVAAVVAGQHRPARRGRREGTPADAAEQFMRRMIGDERWAALPEPTRAARRAEGVAFVEEIADLGASAAVGRRRASTCRSWRCTAR